ncbi:MAG: Tat pathway signal sequence domain protein [Brevundimonas sp.]|uniref:Tat pathway signal sequence domain protein n=1 Tax=Brevundimonas albigilva TaxID=1312364 RepID=A0ABY4SJY7_9CAUL|nr:MULTISPECIES: Tat pathway signal sequence domain protein [Brevundimonas]PZU56478.1 MAG: Tat pathway signal sequence domain protein [Brevundimonas sp.]UQV17924.1 Tat pathway signal sequence domain protein [Brevundimonas albigilva]URI14151.1 Tat pathway signal sequence domain protein [Brevundimonas albigilva]
MRRALTALAALSVAAALVPAAAQAQTSPRDRQSGQQAEPEQRSRAPRIAPLRRRANAGPCPYVKVLYDAARYVELADDRATIANVGYTGEIEGVSADCEYRESDPIRLDMQILFDLGRGAQATGDRKTYRYWVAVTERNSAVLAKEYFDLPVDFQGQRETSVREERTIVIPRADVSTSGSNFEVLVGFDVTPQMAEFNRSGSRFRVNAGAPQTQTPPSQ